MIDRPSPPMIVALCLSAALVIGIGVAGVYWANTFGQNSDTGPAAPVPPTETGPVPVVPVAAPNADSPYCATLLHGLPATLANGNTPLRRQPLVPPAPASTAAWRGSVGDPVVLRCGLERSPELTATSELLEVSGVRWLRVAGIAEAATWYAVDRPVTVALTLPGTVNTGPIQDVSTAIGKAMPAVAVNP
jgi:hypothetical protein